MKVTAITVDIGELLHAVEVMDVMHDSLAEVEYLEGLVPLREVFNDPLGIDLGILAVGSCQTFPLGMSLPSLQKMKHSGLSWALQLQHQIHLARNRISHISASNDQPLPRLWSPTLTPATLAPTPHENNCANPEGTSMPSCGLKMNGKQNSCTLHSQLQG